MGETPVLRGGCQCGAVRYSARVEGNDAYYCHCRMCQKALGNLFGVFLAVGRGDLEWEGEPAYFHSSAIARRGFCRECGTPLTFEYPDDERKIDVTVGSLDEPGRVRPAGHFGSESIVGPFFTDDGLPLERTEDSEELAERWRVAHGSDSATGPLSNSGGS